MANIASERMIDSIIPVNLFGKDHWSTLAYVETVMVDCGGFQVGFDPRMRACRRHYRVMREQCPNPKRASPRSESFLDLAAAMSGADGTILADGKRVDGHDDWHCVQDLADAGMFDTAADHIEPGVTINLSDYGRVVCSALRDHKAKGGTFKTFVAPAKVVAPAAPAKTAAKKTGNKGAAKKARHK